MKKELHILEQFRIFASKKGYDVAATSDWGQKRDGECYRTIRIVKVLSPERIEILEEGKGIYDVDLNNMKEINNTLRYQRLFKKLYKDKCRP